MIKTNVRASTKAFGTALAVAICGSKFGEKSPSPTWGTDVAIDQIAFAIITLAVGRALVAGFNMGYVNGLPARLSLVILALFVMWAGPRVFGRDWYYEGFIAGLLFGDFYGSVATELTDQAVKKSN